MVRGAEGGRLHVDKLVKVWRKDGAEAWRECCLPPGHCVPPALDLMRVTYLFAFDLPLSAVGDTLTLPITVPATTNREEGVRADKAPVDAFTGRG